MHGSDERMVNWARHENLGRGSGAVASWCVVARSVSCVRTIRGIASHVRVRIGRRSVGVVACIAAVVGRRSTVRGGRRVECTVVHGATGCRDVGVAARVAAVTIVGVLRKLLLSVGPRSHVIAALGWVGWKLVGEGVVAIIVVALTLTVTLTLALALVQTLGSVVAVASFSVLALTLECCALL